MFLINQLPKAAQRICSMFVLLKVMAQHLLHIKNNFCSDFLSIVLNIWHQNFFLNDMLKESRKGKLGTHPLVLIKADAQNYV